MNSHQNDNQVTEFGDQFWHSKKQLHFSHFPFLQNTQGISRFSVQLVRWAFYLFSQAHLIYNRI